MKFNEIFTKEKYEDHILWYESNGVGGNRLDLGDANLEYMDFSGANFQRANLRGANLFGVDFSKVKIDGADFRDAKLACTTIFSGSNFKKAIFKDNDKLGVSNDIK